MMKYAYLQSNEETLEKGIRETGRILAFMRAMHWHYWTAHWQVHGDPSYGDHLLFQRLYEGMQDEIDGLAEKSVGYFGYKSVDSVPQIEITKMILSRFDHIDCVHKKGLTLERVFQRELKHYYDLLKTLDLMTLGLDDFIMAMASAHETNIFLLQQRKEPKTLVTGEDS